MSIGIMSGTSLDGIDISLIKSDGLKQIKPSYNITYKFSQQFKNDINFLIKDVNKSFSNDFLRSKSYVSLERKMNIFLLEKIQCFIKKFQINISHIDVIGLHGQTIIHKPHKKISIQIGSANFLSNALNLKVVTNFRNADIISGGQGAPLVPIFHKAIFSQKKENISVVNIGGISNLTWIGKNGDLISTDIGPGNVLIDQFCMKFFNKPFDKDGKMAKKGKVNDTLIKKWSNYSFTKMKTPKSFDNFYFKLDDFIGSTDLVDINLLSSLTMLTAKLIHNSEKLFPKKTNKWIICGGGALNLTLVQYLKTLINDLKVSDDYEWDSRFIESQAFAYLAIRKLKNLPSTFKSTTGVKEPTVCGDLVFKNDN